VFLVQEIRGISRVSEELKQAYYSFPFSRVVAKFYGFFGLLRTLKNIIVIDSA
jgi:hypothetical protein